MSVKLWARVLAAGVVTAIATTGCGSEDDEASPPRDEHEPNPTEPDGGPFGLMPFGPQMDIGDRVALAQDLGVASFRPGDVKVEQWTGACPECARTREADLALILTVRNNGKIGVPTTPPADLDAYEQTVRDIVAITGPEVVAIENEENSSTFYTGTPEQYAAELEAGCTAAHAAGARCTNGGLVGSLVGFLTWADLADSGQPADACDFARRAFDPKREQVLCALTGSAVAPPKIKAAIKEGRALLDVYRDAGERGLIDYVNFHWYSLDPATPGDPSAIADAVAFLERATGLSAMSNEIGQHDTSTETVTGYLTEVDRLELPYAVWYSKDTGTRAKALTEADGTLRPTGEAFRDYLERRG